MGTTGLITVEGLRKSQEAASNEGWVIRPKRFGVSENGGDLVKTRDMSNLMPIWHSNWLGGRDIISADSIIVYCSIPPQQADSQRIINEIYLFAEDIHGEDFLLYIAQPQDPVIYSPQSTTRFRLEITLANFDLNATFQFNYTQAQEIEAHNLDPLSHPDYQARFNRMGYPINLVDHGYVGQLTDEIPIFSTSIVDGDAVYYDVATNKYDRALADTSAKNKVIGFASKKSLYSAVLSGGYIKTAYTTLANNSPVYLSATNAGKLTTDRTTVPMGIHIKDGLCYFPPSAGYLKWAGIGGGGRNPVRASSEVTANNLDTVLADVNGGSFEVKLTNSPRDGDDIRIIDVRGLARVNNIVVNGQGAAINGKLEEFIIDINYAMISFIYDKIGNNWILDLGGSRFSGYVE